jgi:hypothetical protein
MSEIKFEDTKSPDFKYVYATGAFGNVTPTDARIIFFLDRLIPKTISEGEKRGSQETEKIIRELQVEVHMSPQEFVNLWRWMGERLKIYKDLFPNFPLNIPEAEVVVVPVEVKEAEKEVEK